MKITINYIKRFTTELNVDDKFNRLKNDDTEWEEYRDLRDALYFLADDAVDGQVMSIQDNETKRFLDIGY